jgi:hypothetical protein
MFGKIQFKLLEGQNSDPFVPDFYFAPRALLAFASDPLLQPEQ